MSCMDNLEMLRSIFGEPLCESPIFARFISAEFRPPGHRETSLLILEASGLDATRFGNLAVEGIKPKV